jgi:hypothetical protein
MAERLGNVLYWLGVTIAVLSIGGTLLGATQATDDAAKYGLPLLGFIGGALSYGIGWTLRYILSGRKL